MSVGPNREELASEVCSVVRQVTGARSAQAGTRIQSLWSGYGEIRRFDLTGASVSSVVVKQVAPPQSPQHPRGWNTDASHRRKLHSYDVEMNWYLNWSAQCDTGCRVAKVLDASRRGTGWLFVLEDLDGAGFAERRQDANDRELNACLAWLAAFHAQFMGDTPTDLWQVGTYWHLATRPDELAALADTELREAAPLIDARLNDCKFKSLVHGDAKVANFCFASGGGAVAAVDFQYVGGGCGIKDVAYLLSSCLESEACERHGQRHLDTYFALLRENLQRLQVNVNADAVEEQWRKLYPFAWADFYRFLGGWRPGHWKMHPFSERMTRQALQNL